MMDTKVKYRKSLKTFIHSMDVMVSVFNSFVKVVKFVWGT